MLFIAYVVGSGVNMVVVYWVFIVVLDRLCSPKVLHPL